MVIISAPSGSGKTTITQLLARRLRGRLARSISVTTRPKRSGERDGRDYRFVTASRFLAMRRDGAFLEWARVLGHFYGTPKQPVLAQLRRGVHVLLNIDVQGAASLRRQGYRPLTIFIRPPSLQELARRLRGRGTDSQSEIRRRLSLAGRELAQAARYDFVVENKDLKQCVDVVRVILGAVSI